MGDRPRRFVIRQVQEPSLSFALRDHAVDAEIDSAKPPIRSLTKGIQLSIDNCSGRVLTLLKMRQVWLYNTFSCSLVFFLCTYMQSNGGAKFVLLTTSILWLIEKLRTYTLPYLERPATMQTLTYYVSNRNGNQSCRARPCCKHRNFTDFQSPRNINREAYCCYFGFQVDIVCFFQ